MKDSAFSDSEDSSLLENTLSLQFGHDNLLEFESINRVHCWDVSKIDSEPQNRIYNMTEPPAPHSTIGTDPITGLINGNEMMLVISDHLQRFLRDGGDPPKLAFLDIDRFSGLASSLGEEGARELLRAYCARLSAAVGSDGVVARGSGDRFFVLFQDPTVRERLTGLFDAPLTVAGRKVYTPTSGGVVCYPRDAEGPHQLVRCASMAMKWAKRLAPGTLFDFQPQMREDATRARVIEDCIRGTIDSPGREFYLAFQPKAAFSTGKITGVEALMRWQSPVLGIVEPDEFIPVAEATRLILPLGRWLIDTAFRALKEWRDEGQEMEIALNISPIELTSASFIDNLRERLAFYGLEPEFVEIEITEGQLDADLVVEKLLRLRQLGYSIAIDDFGRDQSNLARIASLPATTLKIDKSITDGFLDDKRQFFLMKNIISLAADLGLRSVIEGIESLAQAEQLGEIGADYGQGFYKSKPVSAEDILQLINEMETEARP